MAERVASNTLIIIFATIVVIFSIIILVQQVEANLMFWILRPSDATSLDIVSKVNALSGVSGTVITDYRNITQGVNYYIINQDKIICVISSKEEMGSSALKTINCYSTLKPVGISELSGSGDFLLCLEKYYNMAGDAVNIDTWWRDVTLRCA